MPPGIPVASVGIDAAQNAALMAVRIVSMTNADSAVGLSRAIHLLTNLEQRQRKMTILFIVIFFYYNAS